MPHLKPKEKEKEKHSIKSCNAPFFNGGILRFALSLDDFYF